MLCYYRAMLDQNANNARNIHEFTVSGLSSAIRLTVEEAFGYVRLRGEISGYRGPHSSGHCYFAVKDEKSRIDAIVWRGVFSKLQFKPEEGMEVVITGKVSTYPGRSSYQIIIEQLEPAGIGALMALLEERKKKLAAEGIFDEQRKKPLPFMPGVIGIVTSPTGAVIRDMMHGFEERFPAHVVLWPVRVQGETSGNEVARAIEGFNSLTEDDPVPRPDVLIVARGGGSLEDLWGFNDEALARVAAASNIPLISAVGHETDWTLLDLAADARAPTPTKAAEWAVPKYSEQLARVGEQARRHRLQITRMLENKRLQLGIASRGMPKLHEITGLSRQRLDIVTGHMPLALGAAIRQHRSRFLGLSSHLAPRLLSIRLESMRMTSHGLTHRLGMSFASLSQQHTAHLAGLGKMLNSLSYQNTIKRGFAMVRASDGSIVRSADAVKNGQVLDISLADGKMTATVNDNKKSPLKKRSTAGAGKRKKPYFDPNGQGSLF
jgi:exodeoxyribonuclease VII large subunit